ncbi:MAG TPA: 50S ribosomal protein L4, partial [Acidobacteriota bacterium]|nr:50S ribosomal protein L4 [Acidobacteriota bacterium]
RDDLIQRAVLAIQNNNRQQYGAYEHAGMRHAVDLSKRRRDYKGVYGKGASRIPKKVMSRNGSQMHLVAANVPQAVGGRNAHPPKPSKDWTQKINDDERKKAIRSALSAVVDKKIVGERGHKIPASYPFLLDSSFESIAKTKDFFAALNTIGFDNELVRSSVKRIRAGKGKLRGRRYKRTVGPLVVVSDACNASKAAKNIPGVDVVKVSQLNVEDLAPGCVAGRAVLFTKAAVEKIKEGNLFL